LPAVLGLAKPGALLVALIKTQFEVGKGRVGKGGIVREPELHAEVCEAYDKAANGTLDVDGRMRLRLATTYGMNEATDVSIAAYRASGTTAILNSAPFERRFRDAMSASQHLQGMMGHAEMVGRHILGVENKLQNL
jgi:alkylation response protein AidB-like acyl-CoA dehydrogenase